jgi:PAS domain-containing protein
VAVVREVLVRILANPALLRALVVLFSAVIAFVVGLAFIRFLRQQIADESDVSDETPKSLDALPMHLYNTVIQQLKQQKQEILVQSQSEQQRAKASEALHQAVLADLPCGVLIFGPNGLVKTSNPAAKTILGFASMTGMSAEDVFRGAVVRTGTLPSSEKSEAAAPAEPNSAAEEIRTMLRERCPRRECQSAYETPAGDNRFIAMTVSSITASDGTLLGVACLINDVSELERLRLREQNPGNVIPTETALSLRNSLRTLSEAAHRLATSRDPGTVEQLANDMRQKAAELDRVIENVFTGAHSDTAATAAAGS